MPCTERVIVPVKGRTEDWKEPYKNLLLLLKQQPGYIRTRWGPRSEDMSKLDLMIGWESEEASKAFAETNEFKEGMAQMSTIIAGPVEHYYIQFKPYALQRAINSPIVEMITIKNFSGNEDEIRAQIETARDIAGVTDISSGCSTGEVTGSGNIFAGAIGWESLEASKAADKSSYVPSGVGSVEIHHVNYNFPVKGFSVTN